MTSPLNSLGKHVRRPFRDRKLCGSGEESLKITLESLGDLEGRESRLFSDRQTLDDLTEEITSHMAINNIAKYSNTLLKTNKSEQSVCQPLSKDYEIISKLMERIQVLEQTKRFNEKELKDKNLRIKVLEDKCNLYKSVHDINDVKYDRLREMENKCEQLENKIFEMEGFLADYGLVWVGDKSTPGDTEINAPDNFIISSNPPTSRNFVIDYDKIFKNINDLNVLVNYDETQITMTSPQRLELKKQKAVSITFYSNGLFLFNGPFRPFSDEGTRQIVQDFQDGYFPSELESRYPNGVSIEGIDRRNIMYDIKPVNVFQGLGRTLGRSSTTAKLLWQKKSKSDDQIYNQPYTEVLTSDASTNITMERFLRKLPQQTITKDGKVLTIRNSIKDIIENRSAIQNINSPKHIEILEESAKDLSNMAQIKIRSLAGDKVYHIVIKKTDLVEDLYRKLYEVSNISSENCVLVLSFPCRKMLNDFSQTIEDCGLMPTASLHIEALHC